MRYAKYKKTGIEWLPQVPAEWEVKKVRQCFNLRSQKVSEEDYAPLSVAKMGIVPKLEDAAISLAEGDTRKLVRKNDYVVNSRSDRKGSCGIAPCDGSVTTISIVLEPKNVVPRYIHYLFRSTPWVEEFYRNGRGIVADLWTTRYQEMRNMQFPYPPLAEQEKIVKYLDEKCGKIDEAVKAKEREVELLKECKQSLIAEAVTKGVQGKRKMKQTGIEWLPQVPAEWEVKRAKYLFVKHQRPVNELCDIVTAFRDGQVTLRKNRRLTGFTEATDYSGYQMICKGDLVIHQMDAFAGCAGVSDSDGMGSPILIACLPRREDVNVHYYAHVVRLMGHNGYIKSLARGIRERSSDFRYDTFARQYLPIPPLAEQEKIVKYLDEKCGKIDEAVKAKEHEVELLKELKQSVIAEAVTGQRKVV
jgi:type I restriction enzyme S subunit